MKIHGLSLDKEGRCLHYHKKEDIVALKCYACGKYYACYQCHNAEEEHEFRPYPVHSLQNDFVALCAVCFNEMTYAEYKSTCGCPNCKSPFNPLCALHDELYFSNEEQE